MEYYNSRKILGLFISMLFVSALPVWAGAAGIEINSGCSNCTVTTIITGNTITGNGGGTGVNITVSGSAASSNTVSGNRISNYATGVNITNSGGPMTINNLNNNTYTNNGTNYKVNGPNVTQTSKSRRK